MTGGVRGTIAKVLSLNAEHLSFPEMQKLIFIAEFKSNTENVV